MTPTLPADAVASIANRLARLTIPLPMNVGEDPTLDKKEEYLKSQLQRDAGVFLERYGEQLTPAERKQFEGLRSDFEVDFYLRHLEDTDASRGATTRNRRLAYMNRLEEEGEYFSEVRINCFPLVRFCLHWNVGVSTEHEYMTCFLKRLD